MMNCPTPNAHAREIHTAVRILHHDTATTATTPLRGGWPDEGIWRDFDFSKNGKLENWKTGSIS
jgi:hypothetical protein